MRPSAARDLSLTQLSYFIAAAEHGSMTLAAASLFVAQSAISTSIGNLEESLGTQLFIRRRAKGLLLTSSGSELLVRARGILSSVEDAVDALRPETISGHLDAACYSTLAPFYLPEILETTGQEYPDLQLRIRDLSADGINDAVVNRAIEVALTYDIGLDPSLHIEKLATVPLYAAVADSHPLAARSEISLAELVDEPMVLLDMPVSRDYFLNTFLERGLTPVVGHRFASFEAVRGMVARNHGFTLLHQKPALDYTYDGRMVHTLRVTDEVPGLDIVLASADATVSRRASVFADHARRAVRSFADADVTPDEDGATAGGTPIAA
jgi:DNA-binding transcriptional LysR family regulator